MVALLLVLSILQLVAGQMNRGAGTEWPLDCGHPQNDPRKHVISRFDSLITRLASNKTSSAPHLIHPAASVSHLLLCNDGDCSQMQGVFDEDLLAFFAGSKIEIFGKKVISLAGRDAYQVDCEAVFIQDMIVYDMQMRTVWVHGETEACSDYILLHMSLRDRRCREDGPIYYSSACPYSSSFYGVGPTSTTTLSTTIDTTVTETSTSTSLTTIPPPMPIFTTLTTPIPILSTIPETTSVHSSTTTSWLTTTLSIA